MNAVMIIFLCIFTLNQVDAFKMTVHIDRLQGNSYIPVSVNNLNGGSTDFENGLETSNPQYEIIFTRDIDKDNDMPIKFSYFTSTGGPLNNDYRNKAELCQADHSTLEGTTASMTARVLGIKEDPPCPIKNGTKVFQNEFFLVDRDDYIYMLFDPFMTDFDSYLIVEVDDHLLYKISTTWDRHDYD